MKKCKNAKGKGKGKGKIIIGGMQQISVLVIIGYRFDINFI